jgi:hypothetical protein
MAANVATMTEEEARQLLATTSEQKQRLSVKKGGVVER